MKINVLMLVVGVFIISSCNNSRKLEAQDIQTKEFKLNDFHKIEVSTGFDVKLYKSNENRIKIVSPMADYIKVDVNQETLKIYQELPKGFSLRLKNKSYIEIWAKNIDYIEANSSADIQVNGQFDSDNQTIITSSSGEVSYDVKCKNLTLKSTSSGDISAHIQVEKLDATANSSGDIKLEGTAKYANLDASSAGEIRAIDLDVDSVDVDASSNGEIYITVNKEIQGSVSSNADLHYKTKGAIKFNVSTSTNGVIKNFD